VKLRKDTKYYLLNGKLAETTNFPFYLYERYKSVYEVIKYSTTFLFGEEHRKRLMKSIQIAFPEYSCKYSFDLTQLKGLFEANKIEAGNVRIDFFPEVETAIAFLIPHFYPPIEFYKNGIEATLQYDERPMQNAKVHNAELRERANAIIAEKGIFETILVDGARNITEGSRSNIFFIKGDEVFTPPEEMVLPGITRMNMISYLNMEGIRLHVKKIQDFELNSFDAIFFTGTSIGALPCHKVNDIVFDIENTLLQKIVSEFNLSLG